MYYKYKFFLNTGAYKHSLQGIYDSRKCKMCTGIGMSD